jgi:hypothetical protein
MFLYHGGTLHGTIIKLTIDPLQAAVRSNRAPDHIGEQEKSNGRQHPRFRPGWHPQGRFHF